MLLVHAADVEGRGLRERLDDLSAREGADMSRGLRIAPLGVGKVASTCALTRLLAGPSKPRAVVLFGICGAYPEAHGGRGPALAVGDVCLVGSDCLADEGVAHERGFLDLGQLGFAATGPFAAEPALVEQARARLAAPVVHGATVSTCSGTDRRSRELATRTGARVETMEGAAVAWVCRAGDVPMLQVRAVSNMTGDRARGGWAIDRAVAAVQDAIVRLVAGGVIGAATL